MNSKQSPLTVSFLLLIGKIDFSVPLSLSLVSGINCLIDATGYLRADFFLSFLPHTFASLSTTSDLLEKRAAIANCDFSSADFSTSIKHDFLLRNIELI